MKNYPNRITHHSLLSIPHLDILPNYLLSSGLTISCAESLTSGLIQLALSSNSGASKYFVGGLTAYTISTKVSLLGVDYDEALHSNAVSDLVARQMVAGCAKLFASDIAISTTGYAEPFKDEHGVERKRQAFIAIKVKNDTYTIEVTSEQLQDKNRSEAQIYVANKAIEFLLNTIF